MGIKFLLPLLVFLIIGNISIGQRMRDDYSDTLNVIIHDYMNAHDKPDNKRAGEFILLFLDIDSIGNVAKTHVLADDENKGSTYSAINGISAQAFKVWKVPIYKNKVIIIPIYSYSEFKITANYVDQMGQNPVFVTKACDSKDLSKYVISRGINYLWPTSRRDE